MFNSFICPAAPCLISLNADIPHILTANTQLFYRTRPVHTNQKRTRKLLIFTIRNEVAKVMFLQVCVCPRGVVSQHALQVVSQHALQQVSRGMPAPGGCLFPGGGCVWRRTPRPADDYCCGRYASYWNAFLFHAEVDEICTAH